MRILYVITGLHKGGAETQLERVVLGAAKKHDVQVISLTENGEIGDNLQKHGVRVSALHATVFSALGKLRSAIKQFSPDIIHSWLWHANILSRFAAMGFDIPVLCSLRGTESYRYRVFADTLTSKLVAGYVTNNVLLCEQHRVSKNLCTVIPNGIPETFWKNKKYKPKKHTACMVGHFRRERDYHTLLGVAQLLPDWTFLCAGDGYTKPTIEKEIAEKHLTNVRLLGAVKDVSEVMLQSQYLIHLAHTEGQPNAVIEAMVLGVPVIASNIPEIRKTLDERCQFVLPRNPQAVVEAMKNTKHASFLAKKTQFWARKTFSLLTMNARYEQLYASVLRQKKR